MARPGGARAAEARVLRRTRLKLVAWSAGSTFLVLLVMGGVLYAATARWLADEAEQQLRQRAELLTIGSVTTTGGEVTITESPVDGGPDVVHVLGPDGLPVPVDATDGVPIEVSGSGTALPGAPLVTGDPAPAPPQAVGFTSFQVSGDPSQMGMLVGGDLSGTIAVALPESAAAVDVAAPRPLDAQGFLEARAGTSVINELAVLGAPMYVLSQPVLGATEPFVIQVGYDRTTELRTLEGLGLVLAVAGVAAVAVAAAFGWLFAGRALVPVRESLRRQRELAADASHELRTPLTVIRGNVELLRAGTRPEIAADGDPAPLDEIAAEVDRMSSLVDQMLLLARADSDALELARVPVDLGAEAADAVDSLAPVAAGRTVELGLDVEPAPLTGDPARLRQLTAILVDNAIRHAPPGGHVQVTVRSRDGGAQLTVSDDGPGIRPEDVPHVFDRFWRASDAPNGGSGLGLAIAKWVTDAHAGTISAGAAPGGGARFEVWLPST